MRRNLVEGVESIREALEDVDAALEGRELVGEAARHHLHAGPPWVPPSGPPSLPPPVPPNMPPPAPEGNGSDAAERRRLAWVLGPIAEVVLLWWLFRMAWSTDAVDEPALSLSDGLLAILFVGGVATACIVVGAVAYATGKRPAATTAAAVLGVLGGVVGFVGGLLIAVTRVDSGEH